ncbi:hypothetical protein [Acidovorax sp. NCPPB 3576]|uniref:hypothetical protein n=1 Tax=Acidovorax sp. NCPPB 3576 TaxID=2940488 RepID=UPI0023492DE0|nr:hypothetical protein [Acidovorax sp. NCPPB 3576]WCM87182.1 hypothetical protein M5C98_17675 [Acidovorax sp. NCPPB 3576]
MLSVEEGTEADLPDLPDLVNAVRRPSSTPLPLNLEDLFVDEAPPPFFDVVCCNAGEVTDAFDNDDLPMAIYIFQLLTKTIQLILIFLPCCPNLALRTKETTAKRTFAFAPGTPALLIVYMLPMKKMPVLVTQIPAFLTFPNAMPFENGGRTRT